MLKNLPVPETPIKVPPTVSKNTELCNSHLRANDQQIKKQLLLPVTAYKNESTIILERNNKLKKKFVVRQVHSSIMESVFPSPNKDSVVNGSLVSNKKSCITESVPFNPQRDKPSAVQPTAQASPDPLVESSFLQKKYLQLSSLNPSRLSQNDKELLNMIRKSIKK